MGHHIFVGIGCTAVYWFMLQVREGFVYLLKISDIKSFQIHEEGGVSCATVRDMSCSSAPGPWPHLTLQGLVRAHHPH